VAKDILKYLGKTHSDFIHAHGLRSTGVLLNHLDCQPTESILEIGFGTGSTLVELASRFKTTHFFGLERSDIMRNTAQNRIEACGVESQVSLYLFGENTFSFEENKFDKIYLESVLAIQDKESLKHLLGMIKVWLKPGGILICNETIWLQGVSIDTIKKINAECFEHFGIMQASGDFPFHKDWVQLFESFQLKTILSNPIIDEAAPVSFEQNKSSKRFTRKGKIRSKLNRKKQREWKEYSHMMAKIIPAGSQLMEGYLFKLTNQK